eukprot:1378767-Amorphochlora_amoeboformis.AAC.1
MNTGNFTIYHFKVVFHPVGSAVASCGRRVMQGDDCRDLAKEPPDGERGSGDCGPTFIQR